MIISAASASMRRKLRGEANLPTAECRQV